MPLLPLLPLLLLLFATSAFAQEPRMRDLFAEMPDSILRLLTKNNRLDCIDFIESNMPAQVKNLADEPIELTALTADYLRLTMSRSSYAEMKILPLTDTTHVVCLVRTYLGPQADSSMHFYSTTWEPLTDLPLPSPQVEDFFEADENTNPSNAPLKADENTRLRQETLAALRDLPFIQMQLHPDTPTLTLTLQPGELEKSPRTYATQHLHPLHYTWQNRHWKISQ